MNERPAGRSFRPIASPVPPKEDGRPGKPGRPSSFAIWLLAELPAVAAALASGGGDPSRRRSRGRRCLARAQRAPTLATGVRLKGRGGARPGFAQSDQQLAAEGPPVVATRAAGRVG